MIEKTVRGLPGLSFSLTLLLLVGCVAGPVAPSASCAGDVKADEFGNGASAYAVEKGSQGELYVPTGADRLTPKVLAIHGGGWSATDLLSGRMYARADILPLHDHPMLWSAQSFD